VLAAPVPIGNKVANVDSEGGHHGTSGSISPFQFNGATSKYFQVPKLVPL